MFLWCVDLKDVESIRTLGRLKRCSMKTHYIFSGGTKSPVSRHGGEIHASSRSVNTMKFCNHKHTVAQHTMTSPYGCLSGKSIV